MREAAIVATARTPIGRAGVDPARIDDVFWGVGNKWGT